MSAFTPPEVEYLTSQTLGRIATVSPDDQPHITPVTYFYNPDQDTLDVGGISFEETKKWRDCQKNRKVTFLVDDVLTNPRRARAVEIRGEVEPHETGEEKINPRFPNFSSGFFRLRPSWIVSWGMSEGGTDTRGFQLNSRSAQPD